MLRVLVLVVATFAVAAAKDDPLRGALMMQTKEKLFEIAQKAGIHGYDEDTDIDTMRKLVYEHAQAEKPAGVERKRWDGTDMPAEAKAAPAAAKAAPAKAQPKAAPSTADMSKQIFSKFDANQDGKLSRAEMQPMLDATNAAAEAKGEAVPSDFFGSLDKDQDGFVNRVEADAFFQMMNDKAATAGGAAASAAGDGGAMSAALFKAMDKDGSKDLSREERQHGQSAPWAAPQLRPSSARVPPQGAPGGSGQLGTPKKSSAHWEPSHCLGSSSRPPPKAADFTASPQA
jgi:hypothetical protein